MSDWGQGAKNNNIGWGQGSVNNDINWGSVHADSWAGDTDIVGLDPAQAIIDAFKTRVLADGGTFEAEQCLKDSLPALIQNNPSLVVTPNAGEDGKLFSIIPTDGTGDLTVTRATSATRVNSAGLIESVGNNIARLDYTNGSCPSILVEPQRTNLALWSNEFTIGNSYLFRQATVTNNTTETIAPDGSNNADKIFPDSSNNLHQIFSNNAPNGISFVSGTTYTQSVFAKAGNGSQGQRLQMLFSSGRFTTLPYANFNLQSGTVTATVGSGATATITSIANGWYRCSLTATCNSTGIGGGVFMGLINTDTAVREEFFTGNTSHFIYAWGAQIEAGSNATSHIPTTTATVTRNADVISKTGISSLIGQTEGTLYFEGFLTRNASIGRILAISEATLANRVILNINNNRIEFINRANSSQNGSISPSALSEIVTGVNKIAVRYKSGNTALYVNGVLVNENTQTFNYSLTMPNFYFVRSEISADNTNTASVRLAMLFKTTLTNSQLATLTTL